MGNTIEKTEDEKRLEEEKRIEEAQARHKALVSVQDAALGTQYTEPIKTSQVSLPFKQSASLGTDFYF